MSPAGVGERGGREGGGGGEGAGGSEMSSFAGGTSREIPLEGAALTSRSRRHEGLLRMSCVGEGELGRGVETACGRVPVTKTPGGDLTKTGFALFHTGTGLRHRGRAEVVVPVVGVEVRAIIDVEGVETSVRKPPPPVS